MLGGATAVAQPGATPGTSVDPAPDGVLLVPSLGVSAAHFSQPPGDEGPQWLIGPTLGVFFGGRVHGVTFGIAFDHTHVLLDAEEGYDLAHVNLRIERITGRIGYAFRTDHCVITPSLSLGFLDSDVPFYYEELVGVTGSAAVALDWAVSPTVAVGGNLALDLGEAWPDVRTITSYGATLAARLSVRL